MKTEETGVEETSMKSWRAKWTEETGKTVKAAAPKKNKRNNAKKINKYPAFCGENQ